jgi:type IV pilus assembly protein PilA
MGKNMQWFYVNQQQQRVGPCDASVLLDALRNGHISMQTLTWRDGMSTWQPLSMTAREIGVPQNVPMAAKRTSGSNKGVWLIVLLVMGVFGIAMLGILAAIALPAYSDYTERAKIASALNEAGSYKVAAAEYYLQNETCMTDEDATAASMALSPTGMASIKSVTFGALDNEACGFEITLADQAYPKVPGATILFELVDGDTSEWMCSSESIEQKHLPAACRN